jgi:hypothetical protein
MEDERYVKRRRNFGRHITRVGELNCKIWSQNNLGA